jgi:chemotaxis response regulator CheB
MTTDVLQRPAGAAAEEERVFVTLTVADQLCGIPVLGVFTPILADHISNLGRLHCAEAREGEILAPGRMHLAPGDRHLLINAVSSGLQARLSNDPPENFCRPSVDPMLRSAAKACDGRSS